LPSKPGKPKLKTHKAASSRIHVTGTGKFLRMKRNRSHFRRRKTASVKRTYGQYLPVAASDLKRLRRMLPYSWKR
jgi:large subunit ribosomal protein L35